MNDKQFAVFLSLLMRSDPWPLSYEDKEILRGTANEMSIARGFSDWIDAYHKL